MKENINSLLTKLTDKKFLNETLDKIERDPDFLDYSEIEEFCKFAGKINNEELINLFYACKKNKKLIELLPKLLSYSDAYTINDEVFNLIMKFPKKIRKTLLISIAHCKISFYQLQYINDLNICSEAFFQLLNIYCLNPCFTVEDLKIFLIKNYKRYGKYLNSYLDFENQIDYEKLNIVNQFKFVK